MIQTGGYPQPAETQGGLLLGVDSSPFYTNGMGGPKKFCIGWMGVSWEKAGDWKKRFGWYIGMFVTLGWLGGVGDNSIPL
jgi:hypothetical protein